MDQKKYSGLITVRTGSSRLPNKCLLKFGESNSVLEHIIFRTLDSGINPIVCTSNDSSDDIIEDICFKLGIDIFRGSKENKMQRWLDCANKYNLKYFHTIDADDPFFDGKRMIKSLKLLVKEDLDYVKPSYYSDNGAACEGYSISTKFLEQICSKLDKDLDTEMAVYYFEKDKNSNKSQLEDPSYAIRFKNQIPRLTLDYFKDYIYLNSLMFLLKKHNNRKVVEQYIKDNDLNSINIDLNFEWKAKQLSKKI